MENLNVALIQTDLFWENIDKNLNQFDHKLNRIGKETDLVVLPEMFSTGFTMHASKCAEEMNGKAVGWMQKKSAATGFVIAGSLLIREKGDFYNRFIWMRPDGSYEYYDKRHLFRMGHEHETMSMGVEDKIAEVKGWKCNLQVCYDLRFPVWSCNSFKDEKYKYDVLIYVSNWPAVRRKAYRTLLPARAVENQAMVIWLNRVGKDGNGVDHAGDSAVYDAKGNILFYAKKGTEEIVYGTLYSDALTTFRNKFRVALDWDKFEVLD